MTKREQAFTDTVRTYYRLHGRHDLPWRNLPAGRQEQRDPYKILVSEIMLQQTQVERVIPKYRAFLIAFPTWLSLARAPLGDVLRLWQGLGYNRRAKMLLACAREVVDTYRGKLPRTHDALMALPGIGHYTAGAVMAFAYNVPIPIIETNIRSVYLHHFFSDATDVPDAEISGLVARTLDRTDPRTWYYALMDYGVYIKKTFGNPNSKSKHYTKQATFKNSDRQVRGAIIRTLTSRPHTRAALQSALPFEDIRIDAQLEKLLGEGMIMEKRKSYTLPE